MTGGFCGLFRGKKITVMGLGLLGRGVGDVKFLAECGAKLTVTDLKPAVALAPSLKRLKKYQDIVFRLGGHRRADFRNCDLVFKAAGVPLDSPYIAEARKNRIPVLMSTALFALLAMARGAMIVGVTGTRGKTTTSQLIYEMIKAAKKRVWLGGNVRGVSTLALLNRVHAGDIVVLELDSWQLQGFGDLQVSPQVAVFTNFMPDHLNYYRGNLDFYRRDKENIFRWQEKGDYLLSGRQLSLAHSNAPGVLARPKPLPRSWKTVLVGEHNRDNLSLAARAAEILGISRAVVKKTAETFRGVPGRLQLVRQIRGIKIYNDTTSTTPEALAAALRALGSRRNIVLLAGGADKDLNFKSAIPFIKKHVKAAVFLPGSGTERWWLEVSKIKDRPVVKARDLREAVGRVWTMVRRGDIFLFSPGFASFGPPPGGFQNEYDRGARFNRLVRRLK